MGGLNLARIILSIVIGVVLLILGTALLCGRARRFAALMAGMRLDTEEYRALFNERALCRFLGWVMLIYGAGWLSLAGSFILGADWYMRVFAITFCLTAMFLRYYIKVSARFANDDNNKPE